MVSPGIKQDYTSPLHHFKVPAFSTNTSYQTETERMLAITVSRLVVKLTSSDIPSRITVK